MSTYTPSDGDIITPEEKQKKRSPIWAVITALVAVFCCCCLCISVLTIWFLRFGVNFVTSLFGG